MVHLGKERLRLYYVISMNNPWPMRIGGIDPNYDLKNMSDQKNIK